MADCECQCAEGAPVGWRKIPGGGRGLPFGGPGFGPGFGGFGANNNNNNNNNNNSSNNNNASNSMMSALGGLLGMNSMNGLGWGALPFGGLGLPFGGGCGGFLMGGFGPGFGFPPPGACCAPPGPDCCCGPPGPCGCGPFPPCPPPDCQPCGSMCWKQFKIVSPEGRECCFPVAVPWWCCDSPTGTTGSTGSTGISGAAEPEPVEQILRDPPAAKEGCMSASQLLMQRYMIANPPRAFGKQADCPPPLEEMEIIDCPACENEESSPQFAEAMEDFRRSAVLIPSEEA